METPKNTGRVKAFGVPSGRVVVIEARRGGRIAMENDQEIRNYPSPPNGERHGRT